MLHDIAKTPVHKIGIVQSQAQCARGPLSLF